MSNLDYNDIGEFGELRQYLSALDTERLSKDCCTIEKDILSKYKKDDHIDFSFIDGRVTTTDLYSQYHLFEDYAEYESIRQVRDLVIAAAQDYLEPGKYCIRSWLNMYYEGEYINWHHHMKQDCWHGYFTVFGEGTVTSYRFLGSSEDEQIDVMNINGSTVIGESGTDTHRTYPWNNPNRPRITIAFDISPMYPELKEKFDIWEHFSVE